MTYRWDLRPLPPSLNAALVGRVGKYAAKVLALRELAADQVESFLDPEVYTPTSPWQLPDMERAVQRLIQARDHQEKVVIWGDFDCDGVTSTALLLTALQSLGLDVEFTIPLRSQEGHGLNPHRLERILTGDVRLIVTVDCGISNQAEIDQAQAQGVDVIISDHHLLPATLPAAHAVVNPLRLPPDHPLRVLPGVGVAYKMAEALFERLEQPGIQSYLDLATVGIVADVAVLQRECRYLVQRGLPVLSQTSRQGLQQLIETVMPGSRSGDLTATDVGFKLAPKLNAIGRLDDAGLAVELLTTRDPQRATELVDAFIVTNEERKILTEAVVEDAQAQVELQNLADQGGIVLAQTGWHAGVLGIAASRLAETYGCPTVLLTIPPDGREASGSGRSVPTVDLAAALDAIDPLLLSHGGHPMAAGLRVSLDHLASAQAALIQELGSRLANGEITRTLVIEIALDLHLMKQHRQSLEDELGILFEQLQQLEPFGHGNPRPIIALLNLPIVKTRQRGQADTLGVSRNGDHLSLQVGSRKLWWWREGDRLSDLNRHSHVDVALVLEPTDYQDQVWGGVIKAIRPAGSEGIVPLTGIPLQVSDQRQQSSLLDPVAVGDAVFDGSTGSLPSAHRLWLQSWPRTPSALQTLLQQVQPQQIILTSQLTPHPIPVPFWIPQLVQLGQQQALTGPKLCDLGIPPDLADTLLNHAHVSSTEGGRTQGWITLLEEARAFQQWLGDASGPDIEKLCKRLMRKQVTARAAVA